MPKRYTVEMTITNEETGTQVDADSYTERYDDDEEAKGKFQDKKQAAQNAGKGRPGQG
jgi:hypothetical protein